MPSGCSNLRIAASVTIGRTGHVEVLFYCFSVCVMCSTMYKVSIKCREGAVAPELGTVMTSFTGRN